MPNPASINFSKIREKVLHYANESLKQFMEQVQEDEVNQLISSLQAACSQAKDGLDKEFCSEGLDFMRKFRDFTYGRKITKHMYFSVEEPVAISTRKSLTGMAHQVISLCEQRNSHLSFRA